jgi:hypothetical protein
MAMDAAAAAPAMLAPGAAAAQEGTENIFKVMSNQVRDSQLYTA